MSAPGVFSSQKEIADYLQTSTTTLKKYKDNLPIFFGTGAAGRYYSSANILDFVLRNLRCHHRFPDDMTFSQIAEAVGVDGFSEEAVYSLSTAQKAITIAFNNLKGGVAKTTSVANVAAILATLRQRVLIVDMDMQNQLSDHFFDEEIPPEKDCLFEGKSILQVFQAYSQKDEVNKKLLADTIVKVDVGNRRSVDLLPSEYDLDRGVVSAKGSVDNFEFLLKRQLELLHDDYDFILIDTPPVSSTLLSLSFYASDYITFVVAPENKSDGSFRYLYKQIKKLKKKAKEFNITVKSEDLILSRFKNPRSSDTSAAVSESIIRKCKKEGINYYKFEEKELVSRADMACESLIAFGERTEALGVIHELVDYCIKLIENKRK